MKAKGDHRDREFWVAVGSQLRGQRMKRGAGLRQVARELGVSPSYISQVELGKKGIGPSMIMRFCQIYGTSLDQLTAGVHKDSQN